MTRRPSLAEMAATSRDPDIAQAWQDSERLVRVDMGSALGPLTVETFVSRYRDDPPEMARLVGYTVSKAGATHFGCYWRVCWRQAKRRRAGASPRP